MYEDASRRLAREDWAKHLTTTPITYQEALTEMAAQLSAAQGEVQDAVAQVAGKAREATELQAQRDAALELAAECEQLLARLGDVDAGNQRDWRAAYLTGKVEGQRQVRAASDRAAAAEEGCRAAEARRAEAHDEVARLKVRDSGLGFEGEVEKVGWRGTH